METKYCSLNGSGENLMDFMISHRPITKLLGFRIVLFSTVDSNYFNLMEGMEQY